MRRKTGATRFADAVLRQFERATGFGWRQDSGPGRSLTRTIAPGGFLLDASPNVCQTECSGRPGLSSRGVAGTESTMHILSKLCLAFALILGFVGTYVATQVAKKRNAIAETVVAEKKKRDTNIEQLSTLKITRQRELDELNRLQADWGRQWSAKAVTDPANATVVVNVGIQQGLGVQVPNRPEEVVHLFVDQAEGELAATLVSSK